MGTDEGPAATREMGRSLISCPTRPPRCKRAAARTATAGWSPPSSSPHQCRRRRAYRLVRATLRFLGYPGLSLLTLLAALADRLAISIYGETRLSVSFIPIFAVAVLYGPSGVAIAGPIAAVAVHIPHQPLGLLLPFNIGNVTIAITLAAVTFEAMAGLARDEIRPVMLPAALTAAAVPMW